MCKNFENITAVVPARINSTRIHRKVLQKIDTEYGNISLLELKLRELKKIFDKIIVSCGENEVVDIALSLKVSISYREENFIKSGYTVSTQESIREVIKDVKTDHTAWCPPVVPFHNADVFQNAVHKYFELDASYDSLATVSEDKGYYWFEGSPVNYYCDYRHVQSQLLKPLKKISNGIYISKTENIRRLGYFLGEQPFLLPVNKIQCLDIDDIDDLYIAKAIARYRHQASQNHK